MLLHYTVKKSQSQFCIAPLRKYNNPQPEKITPAVTGTLFLPRDKKILSLNGTKNPLA
jgi:hypothetical protein